MNHRRRLPMPGPTPVLPILGNLLSLGAAPHLAVVKMAQKYGDIMCLYFGAESVVIVNSPELAKHVMVTEGVAFAGRFPDKHMMAVLVVLVLCYALAAYVFGVIRVPTTPQMTEGGADIAFSDHNEELRGKRKIVTTQLFTARQVLKVIGNYSRPICLISFFV